MTGERKSMTCNSPECEFFDSGQPHSCGLPDFLHKDFKLRDAGRLRKVAEEYHCQNPLIAEVCNRAGQRSRRRF